MTNGVTGKIDVKDKNSTSMTVNFDEVAGFEDGTFDWGGGTKDKFNLHIGGTNAVGDGELNDVIGGQFNINKRSNDLEKLLEELLVQQRNKDDEEVGISGVEITGLGSDFVTITMSNGRATDTITFEGDFVNTVLEGLAGGQDVGDQNSKFNILDADNFSIAGSSNAFGDLFGGSINKNDIGTILAAGFDTSEGRVELISIEDDEFSVRFVNGSKVDTFVFENAADEIDAFFTELNGLENSTESIDTTNKSDEFVFIEAGQTGGFGNPRGIDGAESGGPNDIGGVININKNANDVETLIALEASNDIGDVTVTEVAGYAVIDIDGREGSVDTIVYEIA